MPRYRGGLRLILKFDLLYLEGDGKAKKKNHFFYHKTIESLSGQNPYYWILKDNEKYYFKLVNRIMITISGRKL